MTFSDIFLALSMVSLLVAPFVLLLRAPPPGTALGMGGH
jgi:hypothetical protein